MVLLVCDVVGGMPAFALVVPTPVFALPEMFGVAPGVVLPVAPAEVPALAVVLEDGAVELWVEAVVLGAAVLPAVVAGPVADADVPGALAEVLPTVEPVPV